MATLKRLERAPLLHESVQEALKDYVVRNGFKPGDALPSEGELGRQLGVSRTSVREAIRALATIGILESRRGSGVYVGSFSFDPLLESLPYGLMLDTEAITDLLDVRCTLQRHGMPNLSSQPAYTPDAGRHPQQLDGTPWNQWPDCSGEPRM